MNEPNVVDPTNGSDVLESVTPTATQADGSTILTTPTTTWSSLEPEESGVLSGSQSNSLLPPPETLSHPVLHEIVFVDSAVPDYQTLLAGINPDAQVIILDAKHDGVVQISAVLASQQDVSAVHIISHGGQGSLHLGSAFLSSATLSDYSEQLQIWSNSLTPEADILLYGCDVAAGTHGNAFIHQLSQLTGADVAASTNKTGGAWSGGDWVLEGQIGVIDVGVIVTQEGEEEYQQFLGSLTSRISVGSSGSQANSWSRALAINADGRFVVFLSDASNLVVGDTNDVEDIFLRDTRTNQTTRISVDSSGNQANSWSYSDASISADGRFVVFSSHASNLVAGDNSTDGYFLHDTQTGQTTRTFPDIDSYSYIDSADGRFMVFSSFDSRLVARDNNSAFDVFLTDNETLHTTLISLDSNGIQGNSHSRNPRISADGQFVVFDSHASNLVAGDTNSVDDVFLRDIQAGTVAPFLSIRPTSADKNEGNSGSTPFTFTAIRTGSTAAVSTVSWAVTASGSGSSAASASDFANNVFPTGTLTFAAGETSQLFTVVVAGDKVVESDEQFTVTLSNAFGATISSGLSLDTGTIRNDESLPVTTAPPTMMTNTEVAALSSSQVTALTYTQIANLSAVQVASFTRTQLGGLSSSQIAAMTTTHVAALGRVQIMNLAPFQLAGLSSTQVETLTTFQVAFLSARQIAGFSTNQIAALTATQLSSLRGLTTASLTTTQIAALTTTQMDGLSGYQVASLTTTQMNGLTTTQIAVFRVLCTFVRKYTLREFTGRLCFY